MILAVWKAALVAMHFMHLKFEKTNLGDRCDHARLFCAFFLILMLLPDIFPH